MRGLVILFFIFIFNLNFANCQQLKLTGYVSDPKLEPLSFVTVQIKELQIGTKTNDKGYFEFQLEEGEYEVVFSLLGYKKQSIKCLVKKDANVERVILEASENSLSEVKIVNFRKDRAEEIIKEVIKHKEKLSGPIQSYSTNVYIRATQENMTKLTDRQLKKMSDSAKLILQEKLPEMAMAEIYLKLDYTYPNKVKETRSGVKISGNSESLFYLHTTDGDFSLYNNLIKVPALSQSPMLSPISYSGLVAYKYKTKSILKKENYTIYTVQFLPTRLGNALVEGEVDIIDSSWAILSARYTFPKFHMPEYNFFQVNQQYELVDGKGWLYSKQEFIYRIKEGKTSSSGRTIVRYDDYKLDTIFSKKYFNRELSVTLDSAYVKDSLFWQTNRKEPLTAKEVKYIFQNDSIKRVQTSKTYLDSIDKRLNRITFPRIAVLGQEHYNRKREEHFYFNPLISMVRPLFPGGTRINYGSQYERIFKSKRSVKVSGELSYGIRNKDILGNIGLNHLYNPFSRAFFNISAGRSFDFVYQGDGLLNLFRRSNFYRRTFIDFQHGIELRNGLFLYNYLEFAHRQPITDLQFGREFDSLYTINNNPINFNPYNVIYFATRVEYTPFQMYLREPKQKVILGSNYPTFYAFYRKGVPTILKSDINFDYLEFGIKQKLKLGLAGVLQYQIYTGDFLNQKKLQFIDYKFIRRGDPFLLNNPMRSFQTMDSSFNIFHRFIEGHAIHHFNGSILNKIPLLKKLNLLEVVGGGFLILPERDLNFFELIVGIEKVIPIWREKFKIGFYMAGSAANKYNNPFQLKLGLEQFNKQRNSWY